MANFRYPLTLNTEFLDHSPLNPPVGYDVKLTVSRIEQIAQAVKVFGLRDTAGNTLPAFDSGAQEVSDIPLQRTDRKHPRRMTRKTRRASG